MWSTCAACGKEGTACGTLFVDTGFGKVICMSCGTLQSHELACFANVLPRGYGAVVPAKQTYTRFKRFRRYLQRACVNQCNSSVPDETWEYLHAHQPFRGPRHPPMPEEEQAAAEVLRQPAALHECPQRRPGPRAGQRRLQQRRVAVPHHRRRVGSGGALCVVSLPVGVDPGVHRAPRRAPVYQQDPVRPQAPRVRGQAELDYITS